MNDLELKTGRLRGGFTQVEAAKILNVSQPYLSQLEGGARAIGAGFVRKAMKLYNLPPTALPVEEYKMHDVLPDDLEREFAGLGYPGFAHVHSTDQSNPAIVVLSAVTKNDLDTRLVEALPWVLQTHTDLNWGWLRDGAKLQNAQNRLGYVVQLAKQVAGARLENNKVQILSLWEEDLEKSRLAREGTLCRDSMPEPERAWLRGNRPEAAHHWNLLTNLTPEQLSYAG